MNYRNTALCTALRTSLAVAVVISWMDSGIAIAAGPEVTKLQVRWTFSNDGGKTYSLTELPPVPAGGKTPVIGRGEFTIDDPARLGGVWFAPVGRQGGVCSAGERQIGHRYAVMAPALMNAKVALNGKEVPFEIPGMLYSRMLIDPAMLQKGPNTITFSGGAWNSLLNINKSDAVPVAFELTAVPPEKPAFRGGPVLGPIGTDYFTLCVRTEIPTTVTVSAEPLQPQAAAVAATSQRGTIHKLRVSLPAGTKTFRYMVTAGSGAAATATGPYEVRVPDPANMKFVVLGQTAAGDGGAEIIKAAAELRKIKPDFIIHTGSIVLMSYWDFAWDPCLFEPWKDILATTPICITPSYKDCYSEAFSRFFYHAAGNGDWDAWSWGIGPVRFVGIEGISAMANAEPMAKWLGEQFAAAKEDYLFLVTAYPGYTTNGSGRDPAPKVYDYDRKTIHPLLVKHKATAELGCAGKYEFIPAAEGRAPSVISGGVGAPMAPGWNKYNWCIYTIAGGKCSMQAVAYATGEVLDKHEFRSRVTGTPLH